MDPIDELILEVVAAAEPALTPAARHFVNEGLEQGEGIYALDDALQAVVLAGRVLPDELLDRVADEVVDAGFLDEEEARRLDDWIGKIRAHRPAAA